MCDLSVVKESGGAPIVFTNWSKRSKCLPSASKHNATPFASCFQLIFAKSGHQLNCNYQ
jgi:hypothetical protein